MSLRFLAGAAVVALGVSACADRVPVSPLAPPPAISRIIECGTEGLPPCPDYITDPYPGRGGDGGGLPWGPGILLPGISMTMCEDVTNYVDSDHDRVNDTCEEALSQAFAPLMRQNQNSSLWDASNNWTGGEYYHGATRLWYYDYGYRFFIRLAYLPAYYADGGNCPLNCGHDGDSEFMMVDVEYVPSTGRFMTISVFLSAHCNAGQFGFWDDDCRSYSPDFFWYVDGVDRGAPIVWVANGTNANYPSLARCDNGTHYYDDCSSYAAAVRFPVSPDFNFGNVGYHQGAVHARRNLVMTNPSRTEHFFDRLGVFGGWRSSTTDTTPYGRILHSFGFIPEMADGHSPGCSAGKVCYQ
jgi:hypothetical protein